MCQLLLLLMTPYSYAMHAKFVLMHRISPYFVLYVVLILLPFVKKKNADYSCAPLFSNKYLE